MNIMLLSNGKYRQVKTLHGHRKGLEMDNNNRPGDSKRLEQENLRLKAAVSELSILNDIATAISSTMSLEQIIELIVKKCIKHIKVEQGTVTLLETKELETPFRTMVRKADTSREVLPYHLDTQLTGWMLKNQKPLIVNDFNNDERFRSLNTEDNPIRTLLSVPLMLKGKIIGSLNIFNKKDEHGFAEVDKRLLTIIATQSAQIIENARLYEEEQSLILMREELKLAFKIQTELLPKESPRIVGYDIAGKSIPAKTVGGDYFDFIPISDRLLALCLGDVSGKGMPAALLMSNLQAILRGQSLHNISPGECLERSSILLYQRTDLDKFATLFYGVLDGEKHVLHYANAGHNYPFLFKGEKESFRLDVGGLILGAIEDATYKESSIHMEPDDILLIFSDGITEALNLDGEEFGEERLPRLISENRSEAAERLIDKIIEAVGDFAGEKAQADDMTLVVVKRNE
jgi:serine phosphatase RsbU (regulator of sigma subunit)